ncbi:MAG: J domain-containing protein [Chloroflexi bacterium]|nr:J domain-containing protein [Chloroflexota bacterium]
MPFFEIVLVGVVVVLGLLAAVWLLKAPLAREPATRMPEEQLRGRPRRPAEGEVGYRAGPSTGSWDPYGAGQSRAERVRAARHAQPVSTEPSYYDLLGLDRDARDDQIERAYRRYVATIHPDRFFDDPLRRAQAQEKLKQLNAMMEVLRDPVRRAQYDATLRQRR